MSFLQIFGPKSGCIWVSDLARFRPTKIGPTLCGDGIRWIINCPTSSLLHAAFTIEIRFIYSTSKHIALLHAHTDRRVYPVTETIH